MLGLTIHDGAYLSIPPALPAATNSTAVHFTGDLVLAYAPPKESVLQLPHPL